jgi:hypothetical protein
VLVTSTSGSQGESEVDLANLEVTEEAKTGREGRLPPASTLAGGRLRVSALVGRSAFGERYAAIDVGTEQAVSILLIDAAWVGSAAVWERLRAHIALASRLDHKNIARTIELGNEAGLVYVVSEHIDGQTVRELLARKRAAGAAAFTLRGAYNVIAHVCNALSFAHSQAAHGALSSRNVLVNKAGRVKIAEFGVARALGPLLRAKASPEDAATLAPELSAEPTPAEPLLDIYSLGVLCYELLTGEPPLPGAAKPSALGLPVELDTFMARCLAPTPQSRFANVDAAKSALVALVEANRTGTSGSMPATQGGGVARTSGRLSAETPAAPRPRAAPAAPASTDQGGITLDEAEEKWLVQKGKLDFGPFSLAYVKEQIARDGILPGHILIDNENGQRCKVEDHALLHDLVTEAAEKREDRRRAQAEVVVVKQDKRKGTALYAFIAVGAVSLLGGTYLVVQKVRSAERSDKTGEIASLERAQLKVNIALKPQASRSKGRRSSGGAVAKSAGSASDPGFDDTLDLGSAEDGQESERLDDTQINSVLSRHGSSLGACLLAESKRSGTRNADIEFIVRGNGKVSDVRVNGDSGSSLAGCMREKMQGMQFPTFNGPRTKASFSMDI